MASEEEVSLATDLNLWTTLRDELGDRVISDLRAENGPVGTGVILKRLYLIAKPADRKGSTILGLKKDDEFWSAHDLAFMRFERWSKKGNAIARRSFGLTGGKEHVVLRKDIEIWDEANGWSDADEWMDEGEWSG